MKNLLLIVNTSWALTIIKYISIFLSVMVVLTVHEFAHAFVAVKCGDDTPKKYGRLSLNPFVHFDIVGLICFVVAHFGWAKPVPINAYNFRKPKRDYVLVSIAGVCVNLIMAFLMYPLCLLTYNIPNIGYLDDVIRLFCEYTYLMSLSFAVFNLIPVFPLDGFRVLEATVKHTNKIFVFLKEKGMYILLGLILLGFIANKIPALWFLDILGIMMNFITGILSVPIQLFWGLFF